jgi:serine/threonine-protein kinase
MGERRRYKLIEKIDAGGMAEVYKAKAITVDGFEKVVAIKRILPSLCSRPKFVNMFLDEARLAMYLNHANIVQVFDVGRAQGTYFIVMEIVDGYNLRKVFQRLADTGIRFPVHLALFTVAEALKGLAHAHERRDAQGNLLGIVHRDVSPPNILISKAGEVKLTDFGLAKAVTQVEMTDPGIVKGKFAYLSPEAVEGRSVDHRTDIFSAGVVLWELLANRRLFLGKDEYETLDLVRKAEVPSLTLFNPDVSEDLQRIVAKALHRDPRKRYNSARDMSDALTAYLFQRGLKVTSYDLAGFLREIFEAAKVKEEGATRERIAMLIQDEILSLSMIRYGGQPLPVEGSTAISVDEVSLGGRVSPEEIKADATLMSVGSGTQGLSLGEILEGRETLQMVKVSDERPWRKFVLIGALGVAVIASLAALLYYLLLASPGE